jgi:heme/copper-type cytochrome/quinol oxidase subunit 2
LQPLADVHALGLVLLLGAGLVSLYLLASAPERRAVAKDLGRRSDLAHPVALVIYVLVAGMSLMVLVPSFWKHLRLVSGTRNASVEVQPPDASQDYEITINSAGCVVIHPDGKPTLHNKIFVPLGTPVRLFLCADQDGTFSLPAMRVQRQLQAGVRHMVWFEATRVGKYPFFLTGRSGDATLIVEGEVHVLPAAEFAQWR